MITKPISRIAVHDTWGNIYSLKCELQEFGFHVFLMEYPYDGEYYIGFPCGDRLAKRLVERGWSIEQLSDVKANMPENSAYADLIAVSELMLEEYFNIKKWTEI